MEERVEHNGPVVAPREHHEASVKCTLFTSHRNHLVTTLHIEMSVSPEYWSRSDVVSGRPCIIERAHSRINQCDRCTCYSIWTLSARKAPPSFFPSHCLQLHNKLFTIKFTASVSIVGAASAISIFNKCPDPGDVSLRLSSSALVITVTEATQ